MLSGLQAVERDAAALELHHLAARAARIRVLLAALEAVERSGSGRGVRRPAPGGAPGTVSYLRPQPGR